MEKEKRKKKKYDAPHLEEVVSQSVKVAMANCGNYCTYSGGNGCSGDCGSGSGNQQGC